ncbi:hypothetical protein MSAN_01682600 [Mycena sanguinolenta]|uniref:Uncharacterized protein n=1 Tax=Mycena sanguinolenta TaxID=230812 RepID=A0A8H7CW66_9AGAR|nr:hypothetical protein MSAN_01682600 [Mycena sanguinolenta]
MRALVFQEYDEIRLASERRTFTKPGFVTDHGYRHGPYDNEIHVRFSTTAASIPLAAASGDMGAFAKMSMVINADLCSSWSHSLALSASVGLTGAISRPSRSRSSHLADRELGAEYDSSQGHLRRHGWP